MKLALVGATGLVGSKMIQVLEEQNITISKFIPVASEKSVGKQISFQSKEWTVLSLEAALKEQPDVALFSAGGQTSLEWAPKFAAVGTTVIDNSSAWRMDENIPLVVPEINAHILNNDHKIIANPNCSTIQMVLALSQLHKNYGIKRLVISTYQSVTGTGKAAVDQLVAERNNTEINAVYPHRIDLNCIPHCDVFLENGYTKEEMKLMNETRKILNDKSIGVTATAVRVPIIGGHSESVNVEFKKEFELKEVYQLLENTAGLIVMDKPYENLYPMPFFAHEKNEVFVGRIRKDDSQANTLNMWIVSDNLRKGAATNAVQILAYLQANKLV